MAERVDIIINATGGKAASADFLRMAGAAGAANTAVRSLLGVLGTTSLFLAAGFGIRAAISQITDFERQMSAVKAISGATAEEFELLTMRARELGGSTVFTATQAAEGLKFFAQAGFSVQESMQAVGAALDLAIVGMTDLGTASDITANVIRGFNLDASEAGRVADVLAFTASNTNSTVTQMGRAISFVAPVANALGVSLEDTSVALGVLSDAGLKAERAGTGLRGIFQKLVNPSIKAQKIIEDYGIALEDVDPAQVGLSKSIENLAPVLAGPRGAANAMAIFMQRAGPAALILDQLSGRFESLRERIKESEGVAKEMAAIMQDNLWGAARILTSALTETVLQMGDRGLTGAMKGLLREAAKVVQAVNGTLDATDEANKKYIEWAGTIKLLASGAGAAGLVVVLLGLAKAASLAVAALAGFAMANPFTALLLAGGFLVGVLLSIGDEFVQIGSHEVTIAGMAAVVKDDLMAAFKGLNTEILGTNGALDDLDDKLGIPTTKAQLYENLVLTFTLIGKVVNEVSVRLGNLALKFSEFARFAVSIGRSLPGGFLLPDLDQFEAQFARLTERQETPFNELLAQSAGATSQFFARAEVASNTRAAALKAEADRVAAVKKRYEELLGTAGGNDDPGLLSDIQDRIAESAGAAGAGASSGAAERLQEEANKAAMELERLRDAGLSLQSSLDPSAAITNELNKRLELLAQLANSGDAEMMRLAETLQGPVVTAADAARQALIDPRTFEGIEAFKAGAIAAFGGLGEGINTEFDIVKGGFESVFSVVGSAFSEFIDSGTVDIREFGRTILLEVSKALAQFALLKSLEALSGLSGGGGITGAIGGLATSFLTPRQSGGAVGPGKSFLVGERGPEVFRPPTSGTITPMDGMQAPQVNVQVVNVDDPDSVPRAMATKEGERAIMNAIQRNSARLRTLI